MCLIAFFVGLMAVVWVGVGYIGGSPLALLMTVVIGVVYVAGALELKRFNQATSSLSQALESIPEELPTLAPWLASLHASLHNVVRLRIEGERVGLPGPSVTPYLVGLLVLLGMLGTFLGMVVTLNGAVLALESTTDLQTIRASLAAPVKGLGVAFGTSVAGVAASAMLGLISTLCRRERLRASQLLDTRVATVLRGFSLTHQRQETFKALQMQAHALPRVVDKLEAMMVQMERHSQHLGERLLASQESHHQDARAIYAELAASVNASLKHSLSESARIAGDTIRPAVEVTMAGIAQETATLYERLAGTVEAQLDGVSTRFDGAVSAVSDTWTRALSRHEQSSASMAQETQVALATTVEHFGHASTCLLASVGKSHAALGEASAEQDRQRLATFTLALQAIAASVQQEWQVAGEHAQTRQEQLFVALEESARQIGARTEAQAIRTIEEVARLMKTADEAPKAAAEVIGQLRQELSASIARDNDMLEERSRIMATLGALLGAINHASTEQRGAIDALVATSADLLDRAGSRFDERIDAESERMTGVAAQIASGAVEVSSLSEAFGHGVQLFSESNEKLMDALQRIEVALSTSMSRSDEQLAYYVAQAREVIDLSIMSQKQVVEDMKGLAGKSASAAGGT